MALDMVHSIKETEAEAERLLQDAKAKARQILKEATAEAYRIVSDGEERSRQELKRAAEEGKASAEAECKEILSLAEREISAMKTLSSSKTEKAVQVILNRIGE